MKNAFEGKHGPLLIAEIGGNHEGDFDYAMKLAKLAVATDVDFVKFQIYTGDTLVSGVESPDRNKHFKKFELTPDQHRMLAKTVTSAGLKYMASVWDMASFEWIDDYLPVCKIGSGDLTALPMLRSIARKGKPIILSTGLSTENEILEAVGTLQSENPLYKKKEMLAILQCTSMYPIGNADANLNVMGRLRELTGLTVGYSDHTVGSKALYYATAMGAEILEFHFTDSREGKQFRDHKVSLTPGEVVELINELKLIDEYKGSAIKKPVAIELENKHDISFRRAVYPSRDIRAGEVLNDTNLTVLRPNVGIDAREYSKVIGRRAKRDIQRHEKILWEYLE